MVGNRGRDTGEVKGEGKRGSVEIPNEHANNSGLQTGCKIFSFKMHTCRLKPMLNQIYSNKLTGKFCKILNVVHID